MPSSITQVLGTAAQSLQAHDNAAVARNANVQQALSQSPVNTTNAAEERVRTASRVNDRQRLPNTITRPVEDPYSPEENTEKKAIGDEEVKETPRQRVNFKA